MADKAVVTSEHRLMALACLCVPRVLNELGLKTRAWVGTGEEHSRHDPAATLTAQAIADAEARGRLEASAEVTRLQGELDELKTSRLTLDETHRLQAELDELRSQANEYGRHPFPAA